MKKFVSLVLASLLLLSALTACSGNNEASVPSGRQPEKSDNQPASSTGETKSLVIWVEKSFSEDVDKLLNDRINAFSEEYSVNVQAEFIGATDYMTKLNAAVEAGNVPDITLMNPYKTVSYYPNNPFSDVTDLVEEIHADRPMYEAAVNGTKIEGVNYYVPFYAASSLLFLRKDIFDAANVPIPTTWEELWDAAVAVANPSEGIYGLGMGCGPTDEDCENSFRMMLWDCGGSLMDKDGNIIAKDNEGLRFMVNKYVELYNAGAIPAAATTWDSGGNNTSYLMGESAMVINVPTLYNALRNDPNYAELLENTLVLNLPVGSADNAVFGNPSGWAIMKDAKNPDSARDLIRYLSDKSWYNTYMDAIAPVFAPVYEDLVDSETWGSGVNQQAMEYVQNAVGYYGYPAQTLEGRAIASKNYYSFPIARMLNSVVTGNSSVDDAIAQLEKELNDTAATIK